MEAGAGEGSLDEVLPRTPLAGRLSARGASAAHAAPLCLGEGGAGLDGLRGGWADVLGLLEWTRL